MWEAAYFLLPSFVACLVILFILGYLGIHVLEREIIFIDIAFAQIATVGSALVFILFRQHALEEHSVVERIFALGCTICAAAFFSFVSKKVTRISQETVIGVSYAIAAAATIFLLSLAAGGDVHLEEMFAGSILWAKWPQILLCAAVYSIIGIFHYIFRSKFIRLTTDYKGAAQGGMNVMVWDFLFYASMGIVITYTVEISGVLLTFAYLIIPATFSALFAQGWRSRLIITWLMGALVSIAGLAFSYCFDFSCGPSLVSMMGFVLIIAALFKKHMPIKL
ncbi:metal ABC transporter permease [bacterium]|nr:metal ABC transporter permease [bacterium]